ncbi:hypothetical protein ASF11_24985 [Acidovorax sp. Leaf76]|uniref:hypothetical protein n=1 Tax=unclassified Acidovorax TaxID=2684926 RepID=UPI0006F41A08|nr:MULTISPECIES: hypothetical protein [unclassified Acidovorax]KQO20484.1 hypothetical protein ASF11_24985 [Acidovorax sp. Leaf76]KQO33396.1 hypothetical protein ASF19_24995 [Acidovorax sp. Leaf84]KQS35486.1 hypothetical protein ASG27_25260 [Acidovorax sp. Leaf191]
MATIPAFSEPRYLRIVRASGWYDLLVTWPFALPWTFAWLYAQLTALAQALALPGTLHPLDTTHMLFANLLGSVVVVWSIARIAAPSRRLGRLDGLARMLFSAWQIYAVAHGANAIVLGFTAFELLFGVLQWWRVQGTGPAQCPPRAAGVSAQGRAEAQAAA